ncbi:LINE-1 retrotransposable element ORF2 protein [Nymphaea thermarum]|nr:LINE-1 retrotransposable element ORF2 protein [Nymphaea thermarum]
MLLQSMGIGGRVFLGDDILPALSAHFRDFYSKPLRFRATLPDFHLSSLSVSFAIALERPFQHQEIKNAVWALGSGKAPDIDGFSVEFFRTFWEVCSADVFAFCDKFAYNSIFLKEFNQATYVLVPKHPNPADLASVMPSVINPFQVAFVKGRRLQDAVVLANKVVHSFYCLRLPSFILKLDISKAFDLVSWEFLSNLLTRFAFGLSFRQWIMSLVTRTQLAVSFNGKCGDFFCLERGLHQSCPLSPLLFNLVAESFSALFHHAIVVSFLTPHSLSHLPSFSTIQYVDDFLMFDSASC